MRLVPIALLLVALPMLAGPPVPDHGGAYVSSCSARGGIPADCTNQEFEVELVVYGKADTWHTVTLYLDPDGNGDTGREVFSKLVATSGPIDRFNRGAYAGSFGLVQGGAPGLPAAVDGWQWKVTVQEYGAGPGAPTLDTGWAWCKRTDGY